jgi:phosphohistidine phosphatase SixA
MNDGDLFALTRVRLAETISHGKKEAIMFMTCITHADARGKEHAFRGLTETGWREAKSAAQQFKALHQEEIPSIGIIVSSPKPRCLETAVLFAKELSDFGLLDASEVQVEAGLKAGSITGDELPDLASSIETQHLLVSGHADLAKALPAGFKLASGAAKNGWFSTRPVLFTVEYDAGQPWEQARALYCQGLIDGRWQNLVEQEGTV